jgi:uncharacterized protein with GYD domain
LEKDVEQNPLFYAKVKQLNKEAGGHVAESKDWTFGDYEVMLEGVESPDDLEEMLDCVTSSDKLTDPEIERLRKLIEKKTGA